MAPVIRGYLVAVEFQSEQEADMFADIPDIERNTTEH